MGKIAPTFLIVLLLSALPAKAAEVPYTPYSTVNSSDDRDSGGQWRRPNRNNSYGSREQYLPQRHHTRLNRGARAHDGARYIPVGQDPNPSPDIYGR